MFILNQNKSEFEQWLKSLPPEEYAIAGDQCNCWLGKWFETQGHYVWGVFPQDINSSVTGNYDREVFLDNPEYEDEFDESSRIELENWAWKFGTEIDRRYCQNRKNHFVIRDEALETLEAIASKINY